MRGEALRARLRRRGLPKGEGERSVAPAPNVLDRQFKAEWANQKWIADCRHSTIGYLSPVEFERGGANDPI